MKNRKISIFIAAVCCLFMFGTVSVFASNLMSYKGWEIFDKLSVETFAINSPQTVNVKHTTSRAGIPGGKFYIDLVGQNWLGQYSKLAGSHYVEGVCTSYFSYDNVPKNVYKLHFHRSETYTDGTWDIEGL